MLPEPFRSEPTDLQYSYIDMAYDILPVYGRFPTLGLVDSMVYDVIPGIPSAIGNVSVNASIYEVQCSALPSAYLLPYAFPDDPSILKFSFDEHTTAEATISVPCQSHKDPTLRLRAY